MHILFITTRLPEPPQSGDRLRALQQLRLLSRRHRITLLTSGRVGPLPDRARETLMPYCEDIVRVPLTWRDRALGLLRGLFSDLPFQVSLQGCARMRDTLARLLATNRFDLLHLQLARSALNVPYPLPVPSVLDFIDALSANMEERARIDQGPRRWLARIEGARIHRYERRLCGIWDQLTVVAEADRDAIGPFPNLRLNGNGVALEEFPFVVEGRAAHTLLFTGNLGYFANIDALLWFTHEVLPLVKAHRPDIRLSLVGARPHPSLLALTRQDAAIEVHGEVAHMHPYLAEAAVAIAPLRAGTGQSLKILEAMATGTPLVATPCAVRGIAVEPGRHLSLASQPADFAAQILDVLANPGQARQRAARARALVEAEYTWERSIAGLEDIYRAALERHGAWRARQGPP